MLSPAATGVWFLIGHAFSCPASVVKAASDWRAVGRYAESGQVAWARFGGRGAGPHQVSPSRAWAGAGGARVGGGSVCVPGSSGQVWGETAALVRQFPHPPLASGPVWMSRSGRVCSPRAVSRTPSPDGLPDASSRDPLPPGGVPLSVPGSLPWRKCCAGSNSDAAGWRITCWSSGGKQGQWENVASPIVA